MHPDVFSPDFDKVALWELEAACLHLGWAFFFTNEDKYAEKVSALVDTWFLNAETKMNPFVCSLKGAFRC